MWYWSDSLAVCRPISRYKYRRTRAYCFDRLRCLPSCWLGLVAVALLGVDRLGSDAVDSTGKGIFIVSHICI
jgi:hypothetical protein